MTDIHGFHLQKEQYIKELNTQSRFFRHTRTGAELLSLSNDDNNKVFGITFRTPPSDSTGVAHILEHSVLCGSRKYRVKEPFVELLKGSLQTFLNAFTYPDKTCYPIASQNLQDFYNLIDVYLDAVFYPRLTPSIYQQEGWHFELENSDSPLTYKGVVFNEMIGAYSSPDNMLARYSLQSLFPDNPYGFDSGGNPKHIPNLTYEQFLAFHRTYYHPSNARIYFYGDDDPDERLKITHEYLKDFYAIEIDSRIRLQAPFHRPRRVTRPFIVGDENRTTAKGIITLNWVISETGEVETNFALRVLSYILLGMPASPLRKALIGSGLGEDLAGEGLGNELRQTYFSTGLKGIEMDNADRTEALIMETLSTLVQKGIDPLTVEAALNTIEFRLRENNTGNFPQGLLLMLRSLTTWLYNGDPNTILAFEAPLEATKSGARLNSSFFEDMIDDLFLKNSHRTTLVLKPDPDLREREETTLKDHLAKARLNMGPIQLKEVAENARELRRLQQTPDPPEAVATIPMLRLSDLSKKNQTIPLSHIERKGAKILFHDLFTYGVVYLDVGFDLHTLSDKYLPYVPLFGRALLEIGTEKEDFIALTQRISRKTGGIRPELFASPVKDTNQSVIRLFLRAKAMLGQAMELTDILRDVLITVRLDNKKRFRQMVMEEKSRQEQRLIPGGHQIVNLRLKSHFGEAHWASEQMSGITYLFFLRKLVRAVDENWSEVCATLEEIRRVLINSKTMIFNITLDRPGWTNFEPHLYDLVDALPEGSVNKAHWSSEIPSTFEGMTIPSEVNYVGKGANLYKSGYRFHGSALVIARYLRNAWLWDRIRVQGGAYGAFCHFDRLSGVLTFLSYRDPGIVETLAAFDQTAQFLRNWQFRDEELTKSIIGAIGDLDAHMLPDTKGYVSMLRYLASDTEKGRQQIRDEILDTKRDNFKAFAGVLEEVRESGIVKILGSKRAIEAAMADRPGWMELLRVL